MSVCDICSREMLTASGCVKRDYILENGEKVPAIKAGGEDDWVEKGATCGDCNAKHGHYHHVGCDLERCRNCGGQFISCDCEYSDEMVVYTEVKK